MSRHRPTRLVVPGLTVALLLPAAASAADRGPVTGGVLGLEPGGAVGRALDRHDVTIRPHDGATSSDGRIDVPSTHGYVGRVPVVYHQRDSGLALQSDDGEVTITGLRTKIGRRSEIRGRIDGGPRRLLFTVGATRLFNRSGSGVAQRSRINLRMTHAAARTLGRKLGIGRLRGGRFGKVTIIAQIGRAGAPTPTGPIAPTIPPPQTNPTRVSGTAEWGVKASFRRYIAGPIAHGSIAVGDGATQDPGGGTFRFPAVGESDTAAATDWRYGGSVTFDAHGGQLHMELRNPRIVVDAAGTRGTIFADVTSRSLSGGTTNVYENIAFATLDPTRGARTVTGATTTWSDVPVTLTAAGVPAFAEFYPAGQELDPVTFSLTREG
ncbi:MAG: HtaA domain-containing protein [Solirubrobacteraceae bacterium]|nr:HtaA domain-containing protein [Solirubrobacteraceae bacterium]